MGKLRSAAIAAILSVSTLGVGVQDSAAADSCVVLTPEAQLKEGACYTAGSFIDIVINGKNYWPLTQGLRTVSEKGRPDRQVKNTLLVKTDAENGHRDAIEIETDLKLDANGKPIQPTKVAIIKVIWDATTFPTLREGGGLLPQNMPKDAVILSGIFCSRLSGRLLRVGEVGDNSCGYAPEVARDRIAKGNVYVLAGTSRMRDSKGAEDDVHMQYVFANASTRVASYVDPKVGAVVSNGSVRDGGITDRASMLKAQEAK